MTLLPLVRIKATWLTLLHWQGHQCKNGCDRYLRDLETSSVRSLEDVVAYNDSHADKEFDKGKYGQSRPRSICLTSTDYCPDQDAKA